MLQMSRSQSWWVHIRLGARDASCKAVARVRIASAIRALASAFISSSLREAVVTREASPHGSYLAIAALSGAVRADRLSLCHVGSSLMPARSPRDHRLAEAYIRGAY